MYVPFNHVVFIKYIIKLICGSFIRTAAHVFEKTTKNLKHFILYILTFYVWKFDTTITIFLKGRNNSGWIIDQDDWNVSQIYTKYGKFVSLFVGNTEFSNLEKIWISNKYNGLARPIKQFYDFWRSLKCSHFTQCNQ